ncbi:MAG: glycosyltransferase [Actinomycetota bacterium]|nr:glycosyltransferase [Actinomycetota bacterium]
MGKRLGDLLIEEGIIDTETLYKALRIQKEEGGRLGWIMVSSGFITRMQLYRTLAKKFKLPFVAEKLEEVTTNLDTDLLKQFEPEQIIEYQAIPLNIEGNKLSMLTAYPGNQKTIEIFKKKFNVEKVQELVVTDKDITELVKKFFSRSLGTKTIFGLYHRKPEESAYIRMNKPQIVISLLAVLAITASLYFYTEYSLLGIFALIQVFYLLSVAYKVIISMAGIRHKFFKQKHETIKEEIKDYPVYTVLVPLFHEPEQVLESIIGAIKDLDYPQNKLDVIFLFEKKDKHTIKLAKSLNPPSSWRFFFVPNGTPTTKPKACNYGLYFARGKYLVIYDAEDIPEPDQLKKALTAFTNSSEEYATFQAFLNYYNRNENFLTRMFTLEYTYWFDYMLSGLFKFNLPIPLGGTSNHFKVDVLRKISGWDPFNVTEDADLGVRMAAESKKVGVINSTTYEEANSSYGNWIRQRSRWIKGYMQTSLVYNRSPLRLIKTLGFTRWASFQMIVTGTPFTFLINPIMWITFLAWIVAKNWIIFPDIPYAIALMGTISLIAGNALMILLNLSAAFSRKYYNLIPYSLLNPIYWILHSIAAYKALWQLIFRPFYWEKTSHGISSYQFESKS